MTFRLWRCFYKQFILNFLLIRVMLEKLLDYTPGFFNQNFKSGKQKWMLWWCWILGGIGWTGDIGWGWRSASRVDLDGADTAWEEWHCKYRYNYKYTNTDTTKNTRIQIQLRIRKYRYNYEIHSWIQHSM